MSKVYVVLNDYHNDLKYEDALNGEEFISVCGTLETAINYLRNYESVLKGIKERDPDYYNYDVCEFVEDGINSRFIYDSFEYGTVTNTLTIKEEDLL